MRLDPWQRFALLWLALVPGLVGAILSGAYAIDPYDTGRSALLAKPGVRPQGPRTADASRGRDPAFTAAVVGNSHIQLVSPERLRAATGLSFVQLSIPATKPKEQLLLIDWFQRHHARIGAIVIGADSFWCTGDPALANDKPFPFWLYSRDPLEYARGLLRYDVLEEMPRRLAYVASRNPDRARPDGYWDYEAAYVGMGYALDSAARARLERRMSDNYVDNTSGRFPAADGLAAVIDSLAPETAVIIVFPPIYAALLPREGTSGAAANEACKVAFRKVAAGRPRTAVVDWRVDRPEVHDPDLFFDQTHYRQPIAKLVEADIAAALAGLSAKPYR